MPIFIFVLLPLFFTTIIITVILLSLSLQISLLLLQLFMIVTSFTAILTVSHYYYYHYYNRCYHNHYCFYHCYVFIIIIITTFTIFSKQTFFKKSGNPFIFFWRGHNGNKAPQLFCVIPDTTSHDCFSFVNQSFSFYFYIWEKSAVITYLLNIFVLLLWWRNKLTHLMMTP